MIGLEWPQLYLQMTQKHGIERAKSSGEFAVKPREWKALHVSSRRE